MFGAYRKPSALIMTRARTAGISRRRVALHGPQGLNARAGILLNALNAIKGRLPLALHAVCDGLGTEKKRQGDEDD
jgi:hypothetical protein